MSLRDELAKQPFSLALSSGFFGFFAHSGFMLALEEAGLKPERVTGSSAGAIVASAIAHGIPSSEFELVLKELKREKFWDPSLGLGYLKGERLEGFIREILSSKGLQIPLGISTFHIFRRKTHVFKEGNIAKAVRASCAVPLMFHPVWIDGALFWDGGVLDKAAISDIDRNARVLSHFLPSHGIHKVNEQKSLAAMPKSFHIISPQNLPSVGPNKLKEGLIARERAYEYATKALNSES